MIFAKPLIGLIRHNNIGGLKNGKLDDTFRRLFGNILAGEILITALLGLCAWGLPLPIMFFEILVACVQALVFTMLTTVYIATAVNENH